MGDPIEQRLTEARIKAAAQAMNVQRRKSPPYGWELLTTNGRVVESGTLTDIEVALRRQENPR